MKINLFSSGTSTFGVDLAALTMRLIGGGALIGAHGLFKFQKVLSGEEIQFLDPIGIGDVASFHIAMIAEFICASLIVLGLFTRVALIPLILLMLTIVLQVHGADPFAKQELPLMYLSVFFALFLLGPGRFSLDRLIKSRKKTI